MLQRLQNIPQTLGLMPDFDRKIRNTSQASAIYLILIPHCFQSTYITSNVMSTPAAGSKEQTQEKDKSPSW